MARKPPIEKYTGLLAQPINAKRWRLPKVEPGLLDADREKWPELHTAAARHPDPHFVRTLEVIAGQRRRDELIEAMLKPDLKERWVLLFAHFGLGNGDWEGVARCLAGAHVPGFQVQRTLELQGIAGVHHRQPEAVRRQKELNFFNFRIVGKIRGGGKSKVWDEGRLAELYGTMYARDATETLDRDVLQRLLKRPPWNDKRKRSVRAFEKSATASEKSALRTLEIKLNQAKALQGATRKRRSFSDLRSQKVIP